VRLACPAPVHVNPASLRCSYMPRVGPTRDLQAIQPVTLVNTVAIRWAGPTDGFAARADFRSYSGLSLGFFFRLEGSNFGGRQETTTWSSRSRACVLVSRFVKIWLEDRVNLLSYGNRARNDIKNTHLSLFDDPVHLLQPRPCRPSLQDPVILLSIDV